jgi:hypothetical protein
LPELSFSTSAAAFDFPWSKMKINIEEMKRVQKQNMAVNGWTDAIVKSTGAILATGFCVLVMCDLKLPFFVC